jgi:WD40 repeat protein
MAGPNEPPRQTVRSASSRLVRIVDQFETAYRRGQAPAIEDYLPDTDSLRTAVLVELANVHLEFRLKAGESACVEDYLQRYPELAEDPEAVLELIATEYRCRRRRQPDLPITEYQQRFPAYGDLLASRLDTRPAADTPNPAPSGPGAPPVVPGYEILGELGRGGMGVVYRARQVSLHRAVALKMIRAGEYADEAERARFRAEAEVVARLQHPNIVQIHEVGEAQGSPFFSLEYVEGGSLRDLLARGPQPAAQAAALLEAVARAIEAGHRRGVIHRDLKPANILLTADGQPKVVDFGLAKRLDSGPGQTQSGAVIGTPSYMAPEQALGKAHTVGPAADVWALGVLLYELLTGRPPFLADTVFDTLQQVVAQEPVPPGRLNAKIPRDLETICLKCLRKDARQRYPSAEALAEDLRRFQEGRPVQARPLGRLGRAYRWARRNPATAAAVAVTALFLLAVAGGALALAAQESAHSEGLTQAFRKEETQRQLAENRLVLSRRRLAENYLEKALALGGRDRDPARALLWLARAVEAAPDAPADQSAIRRNLTAWGLHVPALRAVLQHPSSVNTMALSRDGKTLLVGAGQTHPAPRGAARLWDVATGRPLSPILHHTDAVHAVAFSPDGRRAATGSVDKTVRLWDAASGAPQGQPLRHAHSVYTLAFSPDGQTLATGCGPSFGNGEVRRWSVATGEPLGPPLQHQGQINRVVFSPDGSRLVTCSGDRTARLWEAATGKPVGQPLRHLGPVMAAAFSPDGELLLTGSLDRTARVWNARTGEPVGKPAVHLDAVYAVAFSPDGRLALTGGGTEVPPRGHAFVWDVRAGRALGATLSHGHQVSAVAFSPDGRTTLTSSRDGTARLWEASTGRPVGPPLQHQGIVFTAAFSPDGRTILTGGADGAVRLWSALPARAFGTALKTAKQPGGLAFAPDSRRVITRTDDELQLWDAATGRPRGEIRPSQGRFGQWALSPDGKALLVAGPKAVGLWETATGRLLGRALPCGRSFDAVFVGPSAVVLAQGDNAHTVIAREVSTGKSFGPALRHPDKVLLAKVGPGGKRVVTSCADRKVRVWELATGKPVGALLPYEKSVYFIDVSSDGRAAFAIREDLKGWLWEVATGRPVGAPLAEGLRAFAFSPDGKLALTGGVDKAGRIWRVATGKPVGPALRHTGWVRAAAFSADGQLVATGGEDRTVQLWEAASGKALGPPLVHANEVYGVTFSPDGRFVGSTWGNRYTNQGGASLWSAPAPLAGSAEQVKLWAEVITGTELDEHDAARVLAAAEWEARRRRLDELGGPPQP